MKHSGRGWVVGAMAFQLLACGNALGGGDEQEPQLPARPDGGADGAADALASTRVGGFGFLHELGDRTDAGVSSQRHHGDPETTLETEPVITPNSDPDGSPDADPDGTPDTEPVVVTPDTGWEAARCGGPGTRHLRIAGNLDAATLWMSGPFNAEDPWGWSSFSATFTAFDDQGRSQFVSLYFVHREHGWDYHALMDGTALVIGAGHLSFDELGVVTLVESQPLRLLTANGAGHAVELELSGLTQQGGPASISALEVDGGEARWGTACMTSGPLPAESDVTGPRCAATATTRIALRANLAAASPVATEPWDPLAPIAPVNFPLHANDAHGALIDFVLYLRKSSAETWDYHVLLTGDVPGLEVASGSLDFNSNGSLRSVTTTRGLRLPNYDSVLGAPLELDFGAPTAAGGNGVDGVTSLAGGSFAVSQQSDGAVLDCLPRTSSTPLPLWHSPSCAGEPT
ncbi:MAG: hypothetical protein RJA70_2924, partial [Pseudomonadota bacterium]